MNKILLVFLTLFLGKVYSQENVQYVHPHTTSAAIEELNQIVTDYDERRLILIKIKELEKEGKVVISTEEYKVIKERIQSAPLSPEDDEQKELVFYAENAKKRYVSISDLIK